MCIMNRLVMCAALAAALGACGGEESDGPVAGERLCDAETRALTYAPGLTEPTDGGTFTVRLVDNRFEGQPGAPDRGDNVTVFEVVDGQGAPVADSAVTLRPWMPDHGHGTTPLLHDGQSEEAGRFTVGPYFLHMGGFWELGVSVTSGETTETAIFGFCVEG